MQGGITEEVTEILKELQKLIRGILKHSDHLSRHHVVHHKERGLRKKSASCYSQSNAMPRELVTWLKIHTTQTKQLEH